MKTPTIKTINGFLHKLKDFRGKFPDKEIFFRGQSKRYERIEPSIYRIEDWITNEEDIFREFILRNPEDFKEEKTTFEKLVKMQHYSLPTRLLDITANPLVALFFCVEKRHEEDGDFIVFAIPSA